MSETKKWVGYADLLEAKRKREERERKENQEANSAVQTRQVIETSLPYVTSQVMQTSQDIKARQVIETRQAKSKQPDRSQTSQVTETYQVKKAPSPSPTVDLMASLPDVKGHTRFHHQIVDHLYPMLDAYEQAAHFHLYRLSWGYNKPYCIISLQKLSERAGLSYKSAQRAVNSLEKRGLIRRQGRIIGYGKDQGLEFWVAPATSQAKETRQDTGTSQVTEATIKESNLKETHTQKETKENPQNEHATRAVGVGSKFTIDECRSYAEHLRTTGQGINNPGGFAMSIYRSGIADAFIEKFLNPVERAKPQDTSACPDCQGTGFFYPQGAEHGVVKCKHERLVQVVVQESRLTEEEITEHSNLITELLSSGYTLDQAKEQFGAGMHPDDWNAITSRVRQSTRDYSE